MKWVSWDIISLCGLRFRWSVIIKIIFSNRFTPKGNDSHGLISMSGLFILRLFFLEDDVHTLLLQLVKSNVDSVFFSLSLDLSEDSVLGSILGSDSDLLASAGHSAASVDEPVIFIRFLYAPSDPTDLFSLSNFLGF